MPFLCRHTAALAFFAVACRAQTLSKLQITVQEGTGAVVPKSMLSSRRFLVLVSTVDGRPIPRATVNFRLPEQSPTGAFASGLRSEAVMTDDHGLASIRGILWGSAPGRLEIRVSAAYEGQRVEAFIPVEVSATAAPSADDRRAISDHGHSAVKRWLILASAAGGAVAGLALAGGRSSAPGAPAAAAASVTPPSVGIPSITVGRPQ